jgi:uncharacterized protein (TIGR00299 family) protein
MTAPLHVHLDAVGGAAGDMFVAALLDARPDLEPRVLADVAAVLPPGVGRPVLSKGLSGGIAARRFALVAEVRSQAAHDGPHDHGVHYADLVRRIESAKLHEGTVREALAILRRLAETEGRLHGVPVDAVHFHEIGDWDSLMDVVAAGSIAAALAPCTWSVSALPRGDGFVRTHHGVLPVPAPASAALLEGFRFRDDGVGGERVTPTGAGILAHLTRGASFPDGERILRSSGNGAGTRELPGLPNILRATVFESVTGASTDTVVVVSFEVDDMTGEEIGVAADRLRAAEGVIDVNLGQRWGKKGRPVTDFRLLAKPAFLDAVREACFRETATLGLRESLERRTVLAREAGSVRVDEASVRVKRATRPGGETTAKAESDDLAGHGSLAARRRLKARGEAEGGA